MTEFTPTSSVVGGGLIGVAAALMLLGLGRVAGISGILGAVVTRRDPPLLWRWAFLVGLPLGATLAAQVPAVAAAPFEIQAGPWSLVVAGLLVGFGTQLGSGCTSGHGVCGIARGSRRSIVATGVFMGAGFATVYVVRHLLGWSP
jgi:uncharacterized membrane protein YedE/YeeE